MIITNFSNCQSGPSFVPWEDIYKQVYLKTHKILPPHFSHDQTRTLLRLTTYLNGDESLTEYMECHC